MSRTIKILLFVLLGFVLAGAFFLAGRAYTRSRLGSVPWERGLADGGGWGWRLFPQRGMMDRRAWRGERQEWGGPGTMMGPNFEYHRGPMMGPGFEYNRGPMMGPEYGQRLGPLTAVAPLTVEEARQAAQDYLDGLKIEGLELGEVMIFDNGAYVVVNETGSGLGAFELLVDPISKAAYPEHGANMMWNQKYGAVNHAAMMSGRLAQQDVTPADVAAEMPVNEEQARAKAQAYLDGAGNGGKLAAHGTTFYGYYTFDYEVNGESAGMLSVNGFSGAVLLHHWHGAFIEEAE